jgi:hypothetical protein
MEHALKIADMQLLLVRTGCMDVAHRRAHLLAEYEPDARVIHEVAGATKDCGRGGGFVHAMLEACGRELDLLAAYQSPSLDCVARKFGALVEELRKELGWEDADPEMVRACLLHKARDVPLCQVLDDARFRAFVRHLDAWLVGMLMGGGDNVLLTATAWHETVLFRRSLPLTKNDGMNRLLEVLVGDVERAVGASTTCAGSEEGRRHAVELLGMRVEMGERIRLAAQLVRRGQLHKRRRLRLASPAGFGPEAAEVGVHVGDGVHHEQGADDAGGSGQQDGQGRGLDEGAGVEGAHQVELAAGEVPEVGHHQQGHQQNGGLEHDAVPGGRG